MQQNESVPGWLNTDAPGHRQPSCLPSLRLNTGVWLVVPGKCLFLNSIFFIYFIYLFIYLLEVVLSWDFLFAGKHSTCFMLSTKIVLVLSEE